MMRVHFIMRVDIEGAFNNIRKKAIAYTQELTDSFIFDYQHKHVRRFIYNSGQRYVTFNRKIIAYADDAVIYVSGKFSSTSFQIGQGIKVLDVNPEKIKLVI